MAILVSKGDKEVLSNSSFIKNAIMYKDMLAFYDAYTNLMDKGIDGLPNYCKLGNGTLCLEGICLFMKNYATELGFESTKLTLGYLKVIYYSIASLSDGKNFPERSVIESEFKRYKENNIVHGDSVSMTEMPKNIAGNAQSKGLAKKHVLLFVILAVIVLGFALSVALYILNVIGFALSLTLCIITIVASVALAIYLIILLKKTKSGFVPAGLAKTMGDEKDEKNERIINENFEAKNNFSKLIAKFKKPLSFDEVWERAKEYHLLSYNIKLDVIALFESQSGEIKSLINQIYGCKNVNGNDSLAKIYEIIDEKDWLKFNGEIQSCFLQKMTELAEVSHEWKIEMGESKINPFEISVKKLAKQMVAFLNSPKDYFVALPLDVLLKTQIVKQTEFFDIERAGSPDGVREIKANCISHFYSYEGTKKYENLFYGSESASSRITDEILTNNVEVPALLWIKIKAAEDRLGLSNADGSAITKIANLVASYEGGTPYKMEGLSVVMAEGVSENSITDLYASDLENYGITYKIGDTTFIGYRI